VPDSSYAYASGRVSALLSSLLTERIWGQLISAADRDEVHRILGDSWYGSLLQGEIDLEKVLRRSVAKAEEELSELSSDVFLVSGILGRRDVRNARYIWKNLAAGGDGNVDVEPPGAIPVDVIRNSWTDGNVADSLPVQFREALLEVKSLVSPQAAKLDAILDQLAAQVESDNLGQLGEPLKSLPTVRIELRNFLTAARSQSEDLVQAALSEILLDGGYHCPSDIAEAARMNKLSELLAEKAGFEEAASALAEGLVSGSFMAYQRESDLITMELLEKAAENIFSPGPLAAYVLRREMEVAHLKIVAAGKAAGIDSRRLCTRVPRG
jgi:vacuolar-type H+-ATPase subunit C/Vma6